MHQDAVAVLACPVCGQGLVEASGTLRCESGHSFDIARHGYVNLLVSGAPSAGDTAEMIANRQRFLERGHYASIAEEVAEQAAAACADVRTGGVGPLTRSCVLAEVGAGTAYYLAAALDAVPGALGIALDVSKYASRRAAKAHDRAVAAVANAWDRLPLGTGSVDVLLDAFAPRNAAEFARVLRPDGALVVVTPNSGHLAELVTALGLLEVDPDKEQRVTDALGPLFVRGDARRVRAQLDLSREDVFAAAGMGPSAHHIGADEFARRVAVLSEPAAVSLDVTVSMWRKRP